MTKKSIVTLCLTIIGLNLMTIQPILAADHAGEHPGKEKNSHSALDTIEHYVEKETMLRGRLLIYDTHNDRIRALKLKKIHKLRKVNEKYYTCADFVDANNDKVDLDFYLKEADQDNDHHWKVYKVMVHKVNKKVYYKPPVF